MSTSERDAAADLALFDNLRFTGSGSTVATTSDIKESGRHWIARAEAAEAALAERDRRWKHTIDGIKKLINEKIPSFPWGSEFHDEPVNIVRWLADRAENSMALRRELADERRAREAAEAHSQALIETAFKDAALFTEEANTLRERGEALATAGEELEDLMLAIISGEYKPDSFTTQPMNLALAAWREIVPARPEEENEA